MEYVFINEDNTDNIKKYVRKVIRSEMLFEMIESSKTSINLQCRVLHPHIYELISSLLPKDLLNIVCYYVDFDIDVIMRTMDISYQTGNIYQLRYEIIILGMCRYSISCIKDNIPTFNVHLLVEDDSSVLKFNIEDEGKNVSLEFNPRIDMSRAYTDEIQFINYFFETKYDIKNFIHTDDTSVVEFKCDDNKITSNALLYYIDRVRYVKITREIENEEQLRVSYIIFKLFVDIICHTITEQYETEQSKNELNALI